MFDTTTYTGQRNKGCSKIVSDLPSAPLLPADEFNRADLPGRILASIPVDGCTLAELESILDNTYGAGYSSDIIRDESFALWDLLEIIPRGPEAWNIDLRHTSRSRSTVSRNPLVTLDARSGDDPYTDRGSLVSNRYLWLVAGAAAWKLHPSKCGVIKKNDDGTLHIGACSEDSIHDRRVDRLWCYDPACPTCYGAYANRAAEDAVERLIGGHQAWKAAGIDLGPIKAGIISPEQDMAVSHIFTPEGFRSLRQLLYNFEEKYGIVADYPIFHPWRINKWAKLAFQKEMDRRRKRAKQKEDRGEELTRNDKTLPIWEWLREEDLLSPDKDAIHFAPHWHIFGFGFVKEDSRKILKDTGWFFKLLPTSWDVLPGGAVVGRDRKTGVRKGRDDLKKAIRYCFTHIGVMYDTEKMYDEEGEFTDKRTWTPIQATVPHGRISSQKLTKQVTFEDEEVFCVKCGAPMVEYTLHQNEGEILGERGLWEPDWDLATPSPVPWVESVRITSFYIRGLDSPPGPVPGRGGPEVLHG